MNKSTFLLGVLTALTMVSSHHLCAADDEPKGPVFCRYVPERKDDFAWENDLVAFRAYGPALKDSAEHENSGIDCWFKRTKSPIINKWYGGEQKGVSYHKDHGEGYDGYHVGSSRGCGGTGIWQDGKIYLAGVYTGQKIVSLTSDKCVFELTYHYTAPAEIDETKRITLEAGKRLFRSESTFTKKGQPVVLDVVVGIATHDGRATATLQKEQGIMSCWETIDGKGAGTGVFIDPAAVKEMREIQSKTPDESHAMLITATGTDGKEVHYAGFAWAGAGEITTAADWQKALSAFKLEYK